VASDDALGPGRKVGAYVLLERLGAGGLGVVWKARDPRLNRVVALKFLTATGNASPRELLREARSASALNHPNIVTIFEVGESESETYLAMEFVEGETLRARLERPPIPFEEAIDLALQVAAGLAAAHSHGIVHRDLKPENIMLRRDGFVKLVDFGLAKALPWSPAQSDSVAEATAAGNETAPGQVVGTFTYMSPEQARGLAATAASDVFAWGIVFYEVFSRAHPFRTGTAMDTLMAILRQEPKPLSARAPAVPAQLAEIVSRALEKEPSRRYSSGVELADALRGSQKMQIAVPPPAKPAPRWMKAIGGALIAALLGAGAWSLRPGRGGAESQVQSLAAVQSVAVLEFQSASDDSSSSLLASSLSEDLGTALSAAGFHVASRERRAVAGAEASARELGAQLGVDAVMQGTIRTFGSKFRVHVELASVRTGFQIWSETLTADASDPVAATEQLAPQIANHVHEALAKGP